MYSRVLLFSGEDGQVDNEALRNELSTRESRPGSGSMAGVTRWRISISQVCPRTPAHMQTAPASRVKQGGVEHRAHLLGHSASEVL